MRFERIVLENIRSYKHEEIIFPKGHVLLMGDIGSGKTTILLSIEFALFGVLKGFLSGSTLLRHGESEGFVILNLSLGSKLIEIKRSLKRIKSGVIQDAGYIIIDGERIDGTATELKAHILDLLGYPREFLTKSKSMIFRYTVFTPQEEMKAILYEDPQERLDVLRKVFGIDKYKRILLNIEIILKDIRGKKREYTGFILDIEDKKEKEKILLARIDESKKKINDLSIPLEKAKDNLLIHKKRIKEYEEKIILFNNYTRENAVLSSRLEDVIKNRTKLQQEKESIEKELISLEKELNENKLFKVDSEKINSLEKEIESLELRLSEMNRLLGRNKSLSEQALALIEKIKKHDSCPFCYQDIKESHKKRIEDEQSKIINKYGIDEKNIISESQSLTIKKQQLYEDIKLIQNEIKRYDVFMIKEKMRADKQKRIDNISQLILRTKEEVKEINSKKIVIQTELEKLKNIQKLYLEIKSVYDVCLKQERELELEYNGIQRQLMVETKHLEELSIEIKKKEVFRKKILKISEAEEFLNNNFRQMIVEMEKKVMSKVYHGFNDLFSRWFTTLIEDEELLVRLDESFTPIITQNGYETEINNLSGGEKTSCALSYRLSLNKVINDIISTIKTRDVLILDEPTEGFSSQQLERVRDVLEQLYIPQIIIVSHENKIEGFVDHIVKVEKDSHESFVQID